MGPQLWFACCLHLVVIQIWLASSTYLGCYRDEEEHDFSVVVFVDSGDCTIEACRKLALGLNLPFFGVQDGKHCFAGDSFGSYGKAPDEECSKGCTGNATQKCGGVGRNAVFDAEVSSSRRLQAFTVIDGDCSVDLSGLCLLSPGFPYKYRWGRSPTCTIRVGDVSGKKLNAVLFDTELDHDILTVNNERYSGRRGPTGITPTGDITWYANGSSAAWGWTLCLEAPTTPTEAWTVTSGDCIVDSSGCLLSPSFPSSYGNNEYCIVQVGETNGKVIDAASFNTVPDLDKFIVNGIPYSGRVGPSGITPNGTIFWQSADMTHNFIGTDHTDDLRTGFKLCLKDLTHLPATTSAPTCADTPFFNDANGLSCSRWSWVLSEEGYSCNDLKPLFSWWGFSTARDADLLANCPASCGICRQAPPAPTDAPTAAPTGPPTTPTQAWTVTSGLCTVDSTGCLLSPHFPGKYGNNEYCSIQVGPTDRRIEVVSFDTKGIYDVLTVNGHRYYNSFGPSGELPKGTIFWQTDGSGRRGGWKLCLKATCMDDRFFRDELGTYCSRWNWMPKYNWSCSQALPLFSYWGFTKAGAADILANCPLSCGLCIQEPTVAPTKAPTKMPTFLAPTQAPTKLPTFLAPTQAP